MTHGRPKNLWGMVHEQFIVNEHEAIQTSLNTPWEHNICTVHHDLDAYHPREEYVL